jgi:hypothetical protein
MAGTSANHINIKNDGAAQHVENTYAAGRSIHYGRYLAVKGLPID